MTTISKQLATERLPQVETPVTVRPIRPSDVSLISEMHRRLSPETIVARYLVPGIPTLKALEWVCLIEPEKGAGFVATVQQEGEIVVGLAYYVRVGQERDQRAEPGILVEDQFQGQGIGRRLWQQLHNYAQANQIRWLWVLCAPGNRRVLRLLQGSGFAYQAKGNWSLREYLVALGEHPHHGQVN